MRSPKAGNKDGERKRRSTGRARETGTEGARLREGEEGRGADRWRDVACVGMDQCVNGCCLTRTVQIIVSNQPHYTLRRAVHFREHCQRTIPSRVFCNASLTLLGPSFKFYLVTDCNGLFFLFM